MLVLAALSTVMVDAELASSLFQKAANKQLLQKRSAEYLASLPAAVRRRVQVRLPACFLLTAPFQAASS
jgi:hypothetical protein